MKSHMGYTILIQIICIAIGWKAYQKKWVSRSGLLALLIITALFIWLHQVAMMVVLFYMFASASLLTKFSHSHAIKPSVEAKEGPRDYLQAFANFGPGIITMLFYVKTGSDLFLAAFLGSVASANSDSWASEVGTLSKKQPFLITTFSKVPKGMSGGVTLLGLLGGIAGSLFISLAGSSTWLFDLQLTFEYWPLVCTATISGFFGCILDSIIGAKFQGLYQSISDGRLSEALAHNANLVKGKSWMTNDMVNLVTTSFAAIFGFTLYYIFTRL